MQLVAVEYIIHSWMGLDWQRHAADGGPRVSARRVATSPGRHGIKPARTALRRGVADDAPAFIIVVAAALASDVSVPTRNANLQITNAPTCHPRRRPPHHIASFSETPWCSYGDPWISTLRYIALHTAKRMKSTLAIFSHFVSHGDA